MAKRFSSGEQAERARKLYYFKTVLLQFLAYQEDVYPGLPGSGMYWFESDKFGKVILYPKGDKIHLPDARKWVNGLEAWLRENVITEKF